MHNSTVYSANNDYLFKFLKFKNYLSIPVGEIFKVDGFKNYNFLVDINLIFSSNPAHNLIDRTNTINQPLKWKIPNYWAIPNEHLSLDEAAYRIVKKLENLNKKINVSWSGGIDSTFIVTAFLKHLTNKNQLRIHYSPWSYYEHPEYLKFLQKFPQVELFDHSGATYLNLNLDGIFISGFGGDETHASLDISFIETYGYDCLYLPWKDFFKQKNSNEEFINFCENYFLLSGRSIETVLEARWWFYISSKITSALRGHAIPYLTQDQSSVAIDQIYSFFDFREFESYIFWNTDKILPTNDYTCWKQELKNYCFAFDHLTEWCKNKTKYHSAQLSYYQQKKQLVNDKRWIFILDNGARIFTENLPFFSKTEFDEKYGNSLDYLLNAPD